MTKKRVACFGHTSCPHTFAKLLGEKLEEGWLILWISESGHGFVAFMSKDEPK